MGAVLLTAAGVGTFAVATDRTDAASTGYVVVTRAVQPGGRIRAEDLAVRPMSLDPAVAQNAFTDPGRLTGAVALAPLGSGQLLQRAEVAAATTVDGAALPPGHELTIPVPADRMPAGIRRGEVVAVLATYGSGSDARTVVTVQHATVLQLGEPGESLATRGSARLTLALTEPDDVVETAHAAQVAELTVVRATLAGDDLPPTFTDTQAKAKGSTGNTTAATKAGS